MYQIVSLMMAFVLGVACYRLGRKEGEAGRVLPLIRQKAKRDKNADKLLQQIENYKG